MIKNLEQVFSTNAQGMQKSAIRELLKLTADKSIISFAGGLPASDAFPVEELREVICEVMEKEPGVALQYGATEGDMLLREQLVARYQKEGLDIGIENLIITTASQQGLDLVGKIFINKGDKILVGLPSYLGGLSAFNSYGADMIGIPLDEDGMSAVELEKNLRELCAKGEKPKFIYIIPDFQNPAGITMSLKRRQKILEIARTYDLLIIEDSPYRELIFEGESVPTIYALDNTGQVLLLGTFSKILAPGFRLGWAIAHPEIINKIVTAKQATDLCSPPFAQRVMARFLEKNLLDKNINNIIKLYREKRDMMLKLFDAEMPAGVKWTTPTGGLFLFVTLPEHMDSLDVFKKAVEDKVAFVPGTNFYCDHKGLNTIRVNFSYVLKDQLEEGVMRLVRAIKSVI